MTQQRQASRIPVWLGLGFVFLLMACNLGTAPSGNAIPTLPPSASATPPPTLGYNGSGNQQVTGNINVDGVQTPVADVSIQLYNLMQQVDAERLMTHVRNLEGFGTRHINSSTSSPTQGIGAARNYIYNQFAEMRQTAPNGSLHVERLSFDLTMYNKPTRQQNIVAVLQGTQPGAGFWVVGAHYDSIGPAFDDADMAAPGANDNGTGVAGLIELARVLSTQQYRSSIIFVAFSAEEHGRRGSQEFVEWARSRNLDINGMINLDSIGNGYNASENRRDESLRIFSCEVSDTICKDGGLSRTLARGVEFLGFAHDAVLPMTVESAADRDGRYGDHFSFAEQGYPAIRFINTLEEWGNGSSRDLSQYVERDYLRKSVQSILMVIVALADGPPPPDDLVLRYDSGQPVLVWDSVPEATGYYVALRLPGQQRYDQSLECSPQIDYCSGSRLAWSGLSNYAGVAIATRGADGLLGRLSEEYVLQPGQ